MITISSQTGVQLAREVAKLDAPTKPQGEAEMVLAPKALVDAAIAMGRELVEMRHHEREGD